METNKKKALNITIISTCIALSVLMVFFVSGAFFIKPSPSSFDYKIIMPTTVNLGSEARVKVTMKNKTPFTLAFRGQEGCKILIVNREIKEDGTPSEAQLGGQPKYFGMVSLFGTLEHSWQLDTQKVGEYVIEVEITFNLAGKDYKYNQSVRYFVTKR